MISSQWPKSITLAVIPHWHYTFICCIEMLWTLGLAHWPVYLWKCRHVCRSGLVWMPCLGKSTHSLPSVFQVGWFAWPVCTEKSSYEDSKESGAGDFQTVLLCWTKLQEQVPQSALQFKICRKPGQKNKMKKHTKLFICLLIFLMGSVILLVKQRL